MIRTINKLLAPIRRAQRLLVSRATVGLVDDRPKMQTAQMQMLDGEVRDGVEVFQSYGLTTVPHAGAEAVVVAAGGNRDHGLVIAHGDRRFRLTGLAGGEVALHDDLGHVIILTRGGIAILGGGHDINISGAPNINIAAGNLNLDSGNIVLGSGDVTAGGKSLRHHKHGGVQSGSAQTTEPV
jgi:phage baseplate assembly protein V